MQKVQLSIRLITHIIARKVVDIRLGQHGIVLELALAQRRGVAGDDDQFGFACAEGLECRLVAESDCKLIGLAESYRRRGMEGNRGQSMAVLVAVEAYLCRIS